MAKFLENDKRFYVPKIILNLSTERILTSEFVKGVILKFVIFLNFFITLIII